MEARDEDGHTPLYRATDENNNPAVREALLAAGAGQTERQRAAEQARRDAEAGPGLFDFAVAAIGGTAIAAAGGGTEEAVAAGGVFAEGVITGQPVGNSRGGFDPGVSAAADNPADRSAENLSTTVIVSNCAREGTRVCIENRGSQPVFVRFCTPDVDGQYKPGLCDHAGVGANDGYIYQGSVDHVAETYWRACALDNARGPQEQACYFELPR